MTGVATVSGQGTHVEVTTGVLVSELRNEVPGSFLGLAGLATVIVYINFAFRPYANPTALDLWTIAMATFVSIWLVQLLLVWKRKPDAPEMLRIWAPGGRVTTTLCNIAVAASVWILLPQAPDPLRLVMIVLYLCYVVVQLSISTEATQVAASAVVLVLGSAIAFVGTTDEAYSLPLALFLAMIGAMLLVVRRQIRANVVAATEARLLSERTAEKLREALVVVAAERDARTRFIRSASHDLSQPLHAARLFFEQMRRTLDPAERERASAGVSRAFASTAALLDEMLMHLRLDAGAVRSVPEAVDLDDLVAQLAFDYGPVAVEAGMRLRTPNSRLAVHADPQLLKRVLGNFVANGLRHSKGERVLVAARRSGPCRVRLWVLDDGEGVDAELAPRLFEDFAQGPASMRQGGFGLGLASARKLAEAMGGEAGHDPRWRAGSAFYVELPARQAAPAVSAAA